MFYFKAMMDFQVVKILRNTLFGDVFDLVFLRNIFGQFKFSFIVRKIQNPLWAEHAHGFFHQEILIFFHLKSLFHLLRIRKGWRVQENHVKTRLTLHFVQKL